MKLKEVKKDLDEQKGVFIKKNISLANNQVRFRRTSSIRRASRTDNAEIIKRIETNDQVRFRRTSPTRRASRSDNKEFIKRIEAASQNGEKERKEE